MAAIFTLADLLKHFAKNELYDLAERLFKAWHSQETEGIKLAFTKMFAPFEKTLLVQKSRAFFKLQLTSRTRMTASYA